MSQTLSSASEPARAPASRWKRIAKRLGVLVLAMLAASLVAEGLVLAVAGEQVKFPRHVVGAPFGLRINQPGASYRHKSPDVEVWFHINSQGLRADREFPKQKPAGVKRILMLGDSFTIGYEVAVEDCFSSVLERTLRERGHDVEVLNAGVSGYSNAEECLYLERELLQYDPDVVVLSFYTNDVQDNLRTQLFRLDGDTLVADHADYVPLGRFGTFLNTNPLLSFLSSYSNAFAFLKEKFTREYKRERAAEIRDEIREDKRNEVEEERERPKLPPHERPAAQAPRAGAEAPGQSETPAVAVSEGAKTTPSPLPPAAAPDLSLEVRGKIANYAKRLTVAILDRIHQDCRSRGIAFVVQVIPHLGETDEGDAYLATQFPFDAFEAEQPDLGILDARSFLVPYLEKEQLYWLRSHRHWTPLAHELSGKALADLIEAKGFLAR